jgi:hypothetical protein
MIQFDGMRVDGNRDDGSEWFVHIICKDTLENHFQCRGE